MSGFQALFKVEVPLRTGVKTSITLAYSGTLPFLPHDGMLLTPVADDDPRSVQWVSWHVNYPQRLVVQLRHNPLTSLTVMLQLGWKEAK
jgi:hypothetical protein